MEGAPQPLQGIRVLELAEGWAGPWTTTLLADLGAEVIKIEAIQRVDLARGASAVMNGRVHQPQGNQDPTMVPHGCYRCAGEDRWVAISVASNQEWKSLCNAMGSAALADDARFADAKSRRLHRGEVDRQVEAWTSGLDHYEVMHRLQAAGVPAGAVLDNREVHDDPQFAYRGFFQSVTLPDIGRYPLPGVIWKMTKTPGSVRLRPPTLGEHNRYVLKELLHLTNSEYESLEADRYIGTVPLVAVQ